MPDCDAQNKSLIDTFAVFFFFSSLSYSVYSATHMSEIQLLYDATIQITRERALTALYESKGAACHFPLAELRRVDDNRVVALVKQDGRMAAHLRGLAIDGYRWRLLLIASMWTLELIEKAEDPPPYSPEVEDVIVYKKRKGVACTLF